MNTPKSNRTEGQRLSDLRSGSRSSRHTLKSRKGTRRARVERALREYR